MRILHIIPYKHLYPPKNGGQLRCYHLLNQLSKFAEVDVICYQQRASFYDNGFVNKNINFYSPESFAKPMTVASRILPKKIYNALWSRVASKNIFESAAQEVLEFNHIIKNLRGKHYDIVVLEHIRTLSLVPQIKKVFPNVLRVFDAHNVDHLLLNKEAPQYDKIQKKESRLANSVDVFWACSEKDKEILSSLNAKDLKGYVIPNGVEIDDDFVKDTTNNPKSLLFCGSLDYSPNKNGLLWFYKNVWSHLKTEISDINLTVVGRGSHSGYENLIEDSQINFIGEVEDVKPYYKSNSIAIVPLFEGSGTRLKVLEAMGYKTAIVTTSKGIEGIQYKDRVHAITADTEKEFIKSISLLVNDNELRTKLEENAEALVRDKYSWDVVGEKIHKQFNG